ncbi:pyridoxamine 5'-phosphate oxidase family protein [Janibacter sp. GXQ6167]|uniref:pyridoxamine 5'-phosphate oxidase family protein n=1 Tax=Janibacter sp. GXQ6167 TaxID=3240791 RepID=UPI00352566C1
MDHALQRYPDRERVERALLDALLDEVMVATVSIVADGEPVAVPYLFARDGDRLLIHGSTGAGTLRRIASGTPVVISVMSLDGIVVAESTFNSSANYRSATLRGTMNLVTGADKKAAVGLLSDRILPGRNAETRPLSGKEYAATMVLALDIAPGQWIYKERTGGVGDPEEGVPAPGVWAGVIPLRLMAGEPVRESWSDAELPDSVRARVAEQGGPAT